VNFAPKYRMSTCATDTEMVAIVQVSKGLLLSDYPMKPEVLMEAFGPDEHLQPDQGEGQTEKAAACLP